MKASFIIASLFAALVAAAPAAVDTRSESAVEIEARQVCARTRPVDASPLRSRFALSSFVLTGICRAPLPLAGSAATPTRLR